MITFSYFENVLQWNTSCLGDTGYVTYGKTDLYNAKQHNHNGLVCLRSLLDFLYTVKLRPFAGSMCLFLKWHLTSFYGSFHRLPAV